LPDDSVRVAALAVHLMTNTAPTVLSLANARTAHEVLGGAPHNRGEILLQVAAGVNCRWAR
jgi:hypothetical protein